MQDLGVIHKEVQVHQMVTRRAGLGPLGAGLEEPRVDLVLEQMGEASLANPHVQPTAAAEEGFLRTMASAQTESRVPVSSATTEISGHPVRGPEALDPMDLGGDQMVEMLETVVSTVTGQAEGQALVASMEMSEVELFLELELQDVLPTLVLGQPGGLTLDLTGLQAQELPEDQVRHQQDDQHRHQLEDQRRHLLEDQHRLQRDDLEVLLQQEGHSRAQHHLLDQPIGQVQEITGDLDQDQLGDQLQRPPGNHSQDQRGDQRWDQAENQTPVETDEDQTLLPLEEMELEALEELDLMDDQDLVAREDSEIKVDLVLEMEDRKVQDLELELEGLTQMVSKEVLVDGQLMEALSTLEGLKDQTEEGQAPETQVADQVDLDLGEGKMVEVPVETAQDSKIHEEEDSSLALEELVEGQEEELKALLMEVALEEDLELTVEDLLEVWVVEEDLEVLEMVEGLEALEMVDGQEGLVMGEGQEDLEMAEALEVMDDQEALETEEDREDLETEDAQGALETEDDLEALETEEGQEVLEMVEGLEALEVMEDLEALEMEEDQEVLETEDDLEALATEDNLEGLETEDDLGALEMEDDLEALEVEEGQEALALEDEAEVKMEALEYQVALVAGTAWAVVLGSVILTRGEAKKCRALALE